MGICDSSCSAVFCGAERTLEERITELEKIVAALQKDMQPSADENGELPKSKNPELAEMLKLVDLTIEASLCYVAENGFDKDQLESLKQIMTNAADDTDKKKLMQAHKRGDDAYQRQCLDLLHNTKSQLLPMLRSPAFAEQMKVWLAKASEADVVGDEEEKKNKKKQVQFSGETP